MRPKRGWDRKYEIKGRGFRKAAVTINRGASCVRAMLLNIVLAARNVKPPRSGKARGSCREISRKIALAFLGAPVDLAGSSLGGCSGYATSRRSRSFGRSSQKRGATRERERETEKQQKTGKKVAGRRDSGG